MSQLKVALDARPLTLASGDTHFVTFRKQAPTACAAERLPGLSKDVDTLVVAGADVHWRMHG